MTRALYTDIDPYCCAVLGSRIEDGSLPPGDVLWVREEWQAVQTWHENGVWFRDEREPREGCEVWYRAHDPFPDDGMRWRRGMFMPRWAARVWLRVESVRVERLGSMSEADAVAEGFTSLEDLWRTSTILGPIRARGEDPWVWVIGFSVLSTTGIEGCPEDVRKAVRA